MKAAETKSVGIPARKSSPFFSNKSGQAFFSSNGKKQTFFSGTKNAEANVQTKLSIGQNGDKYEKEADAMADKVVQRLSNENYSGVEGKSVGSLETSISPLQRKCSTCEHDGKLQKRSDNSSSKTPAINLEEGLNSSKGSGSSMPAATRGEMEKSFGTDFSYVRLHTNSSAVQMNKDLHAHAFTYGPDIYFNEGKYNPDSTQGKHLIAHELTHTIQQSTNSAFQVQGDFFDDAEEVFTSAKETIVSAGSDIVNTVTELGEAAYQGGSDIVNGIEELGSEIYEKGSAAVNWVENNFAERLQQFKNELDAKLPAFRPFPDGLIAFKDKIQSIISNRIDNPHLESIGSSTISGATSIAASSVGNTITASTADNEGGGARIPGGGCGLCYFEGGGAGPRDSGTVAHLLIQKAFLESFPAGRVEVPIASGALKGVLDLAVFIPGQNKIEIGEIKPANGSGIAAGVTQMILYETILREMFPNINVSHLTRVIPSPIPFPTLSPNCPVQSMIVFPPIAGIYGYLCTPTFTELLQRGCNCKGKDEEVREPVKVRRRLTNQEFAALMALLLALIAGLVLILAPVPEPIHKAGGILVAATSLAALLLFFNKFDIKKPEDIA